MHDELQKITRILENIAGNQALIMLYMEKHLEQEGIFATDVVIGRNPPIPINLAVEENPTLDISTALERLYQAANETGDSEYTSDPSNPDS